MFAQTQKKTFFHADCPINTLSICALMSEQTFKVQVHYNRMHFVVHYINV